MLLPVNIITSIDTGVQQEDPKKDKYGLFSNKHNGMASIKIVKIKF
jgi:hypothetical protein